MRPTTSERVEPSSLHLPAYAKVIIIAQALVIVYFTFWSLEEYSNNQYFQNYVNLTLQNGAFGIIAMCTVGVFSAIASGLYMKLRHTRKELEHAIHTELSASSHDSGASFLAPHQEEHLIEMIRRSTPPESGQSSSMPVLKRQDRTSGAAS